MLALTAAAKLFGQRPSRLVAIQDPMTALEFDLAAATAAMLARERSSPDRVTSVWL
jgi:hypothetical protein